MQGRPEGLPLGRLQRRRFPGAAKPSPVLLDETGAAERDDQGVDDDRLHEGQADQEHDLDAAARARIPRQSRAGLTGRAALTDRAAGRGDSDTHGGTEQAEIGAAAAFFAVLSQGRSGKQG